jgi:molecular chaperone DnaK (HSP70)
MGQAVGIDLGTTHTVVASADLAAPAGSAAIFAIPQLVSPTEIAARPLYPSCLHAPVPGEALADPWQEAPWISGEFARRRGAEVPGRLVASAKSWLCHGAVDRGASILPWGAPEDAVDLPRISPIDASARYLAHVRRAWDEAHPGAKLAEQEVVLTVPASFDEVARELTLEAATRAGLAVRLLEEPQAAFYDFMAQAGAAAIDALLDRHGGEALVLVIDVGGGTTDLSLIRIHRADGEVPYAVERVAVGHHLLLGGDNMDLALAHLCEPRLVEPPQRLDAARFGQLVSACRAAKERLLSADSPDRVRVTILGHGARLLGNTLSTDLSREEVERVVLDGFFPAAPRDARPDRRRAGLVAFGLPYERDVAVTRHVAHFFARHAGAVPAPHALLLNGGVFNAARIVERLVSAFGAWGGPPVEVLPHVDPDLAVARGAVAYALARRGRGLRIGGGAACGYYVGLDAEKGAARKAVCVVPRGAEEGAPAVAEGRMLALVVGRPVRFDLFASDERSDAPGDVVTIDDDAFEALPPAVVSFGSARKADEVKVQLEGELTAIGTLDLACVESAEPRRRFRLAFQLREPRHAGAARGPGPQAPSEPNEPSAATPAPPSVSVSASGKRLDEAREAIERVFGKGRADVAPREVKDLLRELERLLGERPSWTLATSRALFDTLAPSAKSRRRSADHERLFWLLAGFTARPGFGDPLDPQRLALVAPLFAERVLFPAETRNWQQLWIAFRRLAGGLDEAAQLVVRDALDPLVAPAEARLKKPKGWKAEAADDLLDLVSSLERVPPARRSELGGWILEKTWTSKDPRLWAAIGRLGARVPAYAGVHHVVSPGVAERWIDHLLREKWDAVPTAPQAAVQLARVTGDRGRDVSERARREVERRLAHVGAREELIRPVREYVPVAEAERAALFGEGLPVGLRLVE